MPRVLPCSPWPMSGNLPFPLPDRRVLLRDVPHQRDHQAPGELGGGIAQHVRAAHLDAARGRGIDIDRRVAHARGDDQAQIGQAVDRTAAERRCARASARRIRRCGGGARAPPRWRCGWERPRFARPDRGSANPPRRARPLDSRQAPLRASSPSLPCRGKLPSLLYPKRSGKARRGQGARLKAAAAGDSGAASCIQRASHAAGATHTIPATP